MTECKYAVANFTEYDYTVLKSMISVVNVRTDATWAEANESDADVIFVGMDATGGDAIWSRGADCVRVWCTRDDEGGAGNNHLLKLPVRPDPLSKLLRELEMEAALDAAGGESLTKAAVERTPRRADDVFRPADCMLGYLQEIREGGVRALLHARHDDPTFPPPELLVDGDQQRFLWASSDNELINLCTMSVDNLRGRRASDDEYQRHATGLEERPLAHLLWLAALYGSSGAPLEGLTTASTVTLHAPAGETGVPMAADERKLERLLLDRPYTVSALAEESGLPQPQVVAFVNGCLALGIAELGQEAG